MSATAEQEEPRFWVLDSPVKGEPCLPESASARDGEGPYVLPIVDEVYGGVIAWANTEEQAQRIVAALEAATAAIREARTIRRSFRGGSEDVSFSEFAASVVQDEACALDVARRMLDAPAGEEYEWNADEPEFFETFVVLDAVALRGQVGAVVEGGV